MTKEELEKLILDNPSLYHMAERGAWPSIQKHGLLSTSALLDLYGVSGQDRYTIEATRRPACIPIDAEGLPTAVIRDQIPMDDQGLIRGLPAHITPQDWYELLNRKVFFWLTRDRLLRLTGAKAYKEKEHDVLELDTRSLVEAYYDQILLCPINSGCTKPYPAKRDYNTFLPIDEYPYEAWRKKRGNGGDKVVELVVERAVPDVARFVKRVSVMRGIEEIEVIFDNV